jgi:16S rRNA (guanine527-N7)-methyltransferase
MDPTLEQRLRRGAEPLGVPLDDRIIDALSRYLDLLLFWNRTVNLTAVRDPAGIVDKHFVDSLAVVPHIPPHARSVADLGSGPGFPGAVIALLRPDLAVALVESIHKKAAFLEALRRTLPLPNATVHAERAESWSTHTPPPDVVVSRATWEIPTWLALGSTFVAPGGTVLAMEAADQFPLPPNATRHPYPHPQGTRAIIVLRRP